jgi:23S rRNA (cytidine1920-2'-O)/16S rRNA (cytidine1409-2'-O)-methyltransferase
VEQKKRLDVLLVERGLIRSRELARRLVMAGTVHVDGHSVVHPGTRVTNDANVHLRAQCPFVGRGGLKLEAALARFAVDITGLVIADIGASTGGFTDCLLQHGARKVYAIDVGYGQLAWSLRQDARVVVMERVNARYLSANDIPEQVEVVTIDVSFISLQLVLPGVLHVLKPRGHIIALVKPQFEAGRRQVGKGGIVRDPAVHHDVLYRVATWAVTHGLVVRNAMPSPIQGTDGNVEFFLHLVASDQQEQNVEALIAQCLAEVQRHATLTRAP